MKQRPFNRKFIAVTAGILCAISAVAGAAAYPKITGIICRRNELVNSEREFELCTGAADSVETFRLVGKPAIGALLAQYDGKLPAGEQVPELIGDVKRACKAAGTSDISIVTCEPELLEPQGEPLLRCDAGRVHRVPIVVTGAASYRGLGALLSNLAAGRRLILAKSVTIERRERNDDLVMFRVEADAFCFLHKSEDE